MVGLRRSGGITGCVSWKRQLQAAFSPMQYAMHILNGLEVSGHQKIEQLLAQRK